MTRPSTPMAQNSNNIEEVVSKVLEFEATIKRNYHKVCAQKEKQYKKKTHQSPQNAKEKGILASTKYRQNLNDDLTRVKSAAHDLLSRFEYLHQ